MFPMMCLASFQRLHMLRESPSLCRPEVHLPKKYHRQGIVWVGFGHQRSMFLDATYSVRCTSCISEAGKHVFVVILVHWPFTNLHPTFSPVVVCDCFFLIGKRHIRPHWPVGAGLWACMCALCQIHGELSHDLGSGR